MYVANVETALSSSFAFVEDCAVMLPYTGYSAQQDLMLLKRREPQRQNANSPFLLLLLELSHKCSKGTALQSPDYILDFIQVS